MFWPINQFTTAAGAGLCENALESLYKNLFCDKVLPLPGSILKVDLVMNLVDSSCHTGIYVGNGRIVEMTNVGGTGIIKNVSKKFFLKNSSWRTGIFIYVACGKKDGNLYPLAAPEIAERALAAVGKRTKYDLINDNCHLFTESCIMGSPGSPPGMLTNVETALIRKFRLADPPPGSPSGLREIFAVKPQSWRIPYDVKTGASPIYWMSTGWGRF